MRGPWGARHESWSCLDWPDDARAPSPARSPFFVPAISQLSYSMLYIVKSYKLATIISPVCTDHSAETGKARTVFDRRKSDSNSRPLTQDRSRLFERIGFVGEASSLSRCQYTSPARSRARSSRRRRNLPSLEEGRFFSLTSCKRVCNR